METQIGLTEKLRLDAWAKIDCRHYIRIERVDLFGFGRMAMLFATYSDGSVKKTKYDHGNGYIALGVI